jgi:hypothetical protein
MSSGSIFHHLIYTQDDRGEIRWPAIGKPLLSRSIVSALARAAARRAIWSMRLRIRAALGNLEGVLATIQAELAG